MLMLHRLAAAATTVIFALRQRIRRLPDDGYSTEAIAVTALLVALALTALAVLGPKVMDKIREVKL